MTMYTIAGTPVTQDEFARAAQICIGKPLDKKVISTVFDIFDVDGERMNESAFVCVCVCERERERERERVSHIRRYFVFSPFR